MYHVDKGKTTFELYEEERRSCRVTLTPGIIPPYLLESVAYELRQETLARVAAAVGALAQQKAALERTDKTAQNDMENEGGPINDKEQGVSDD
ncbi:hypothetical protein IPM09_02760 [Candidatus Saccharibacteria bacterium]|nr:MAG: hypothetical protein IPM09_02760 [Candidatus Saccharibacteria bacterium]